MTTKGYIFDLDDTLYCEHEYVRSGFQAVASKLAEHSDKNKMVLYEALVHEWQRNGRGKIFDAVCNTFDIAIEIKDLIRVYREHEPSNIHLYKDAEKFLRYLEEQSIPRGIITDGDRYVQWRKIGSLGLDKRISCIVVSDELGKDCWKPSEVPYRKVMAHLRLNAQECMYIGDNPHKDFCSARKLGMSTVRIIRSVGDHMQTRLGKEMEADRVIYSLEELIDTEVRQ